MSSDKTTDTESLADLVATAAEKAEKNVSPEKAGGKEPGDESGEDSGDDSGEDSGVDSGEKKRRRPNKVVLAAAGVGVLGVLVGGGIGYAVGDSGSSSTAAAGDTASLTLPDSLSGGYARSSTVDTNIKTAVQSAQTTLGAGTDMALYTKKKTQVLVEATRLPGDALLQAGMTYAKVGDVTCASTSSTSGTEAICSRTSGDLTVKVTAGTSDLASKYVDEVFNGLV